MTTRTPMAVALEHFSKEEFGYAAEKLKPELLIRLACARYIAGVPIYISSAVRPEDSGSEHSTGEGLDIRETPRSAGSGKVLSSRWRDAVTRALYAVGFTRVGQYDLHIHIGISPAKDQNVAWIGKSE